MNTVITMAGAGRRLVGDSNLIKPLYPILGKPMIEHVVKDLNIEGTYIFIVQKAHRQEWKLDELLNRIAPNCKIIEVDGLTEGQASSALLAKEFIDNEQPLLTANCDQILNWDSNAFLEDIKSNNADGCIPVIKANNPSMSFAEINQYGYISRTAEKQVISNWGTVGLYYWSKGKDFVRCANKMISDGNKVNNEYYICPVYNYAIEEGLKIIPFELHEMWALGNPQEVDSYIQSL